jgi:hypothetical protein
MWNPVRFIETLTFFGAIPVIGEMPWLQSLLGMTSPTAPSGPVTAPSPQILVLEGVTAMPDLEARLGRTGLPVQGQAWADLHPPWVNVRSVVLGPTLDEAGLNRLDQLKSMGDRGAVVAAPVLSWQDKTPEAVAAVWGAVDDGVMGGVSESGLAVQHPKPGDVPPSAMPISAYGCFRGQVSTANSGGFASVRTRNFDPPFNLQGWQGLLFQVRGDGQRYKLILRDRTGWDSAAYCASFDTVADRWVTVTVPFNALQATFRARTLPTAPPLNLSEVCAVQLMLSKFEYNGDLNPHFHPGPFRLDVAQVSVYRAAPPPKVVAIAPTPAQATQVEARLKATQLPHTVLSNPTASALSPQQWRDLLG